MTEKPAVPKLARLMGLRRNFHGRCPNRESITYCITKRPNWSAVKQRLESHPNEAKVPIWATRAHDPDDKLFDLEKLERSEDCSYDPVFALSVFLNNVDNYVHIPIDVLRALLAANPAAVTRSALKDACRNFNFGGDIIEAILDAGDPSLATAECLKLPLRSAIDYNEQKMDVFHLEAARVLIRRCPELLSTSITDSDNEHYPIQFMCSNLDELSEANKTDVFRLLIEEGAKRNVGGEHGAGGLFLKTSVLASKTNSPMTALEMAIHHVEELDKNVMEENDENFRVYGNSFEWNCVELCLRAATAAKAKQTDLFNYPLLHAAVSSATLHMIDWVVTEILQKANGDASPVAKLTDKDSSGKTPIDLALENMGRFEDPNDRAKLLQLLLFRDNGYDTQVAASVKAGMAPSLYECAMECDAAAGVLMAILRAHPSLITHQDATTGLHPWMLLASRPYSQESDAFELLLQDPTSVMGGIKPSAQEEYLTKKLIIEEAKWKQEKAELKMERDSVVAENLELRAVIARLLESSRRGS